MRKKEAGPTPDLAPQPTGDTVELPIQDLEGEAQPESALPDWADQPDETVDLADRAESLETGASSEPVEAYPPDQGAAQEFFSFEQPPKAEDQSFPNYAAMGVIAGAGLGALAYAGTREDETEEQELGNEPDAGSTEPLELVSSSGISEATDSELLPEDASSEELLMASSAALITGAAARKTKKLIRRRI